MAKPAMWRNKSFHRNARLLEARWQEYCSLYLPRAPEDSIWRYNKGRRRQQRAAGWKLHLSATILNAPTVLSRIAPFLIAHGVPFKAPRSLFEVGKLNAGLDYNYSQVGKIITVYPAHDEEAIQLSKRLHELTRNFSGPIIPFDLRFSATSNVYYRYGAFQQLELKRKGGVVPALYAPGGQLVPDVRERASPHWASDPFVKHKPRSSLAKHKPMASIRVLKVLVQRGKGGVYVGLDLSHGNGRLCLLKEGRKYGEMTWDGRDGVWRVKNEKRVLSRLSSCHIPVPQVYASFEITGNYYLMMEYVDGETLHEKLTTRRRRLNVSQVLDWGVQLAQFICQMHRAGWTWRDCKPKNIMVTRSGRLVPIDFEGATPIGHPDPLRWGTVGFGVPRQRRRRFDNDIGDDLYALGSILFLLLTGRVYQPAESVTVKELRRNVPPGLCELIESLLAQSEARRPTIEDAHANLTAILLDSKDSSSRMRDRQVN